MKIRRHIEQIKVEKTNAEKFDERESTRKFANLREYCMIFVIYVLNLRNYGKHNSFQLNGEIQMDKKVCENAPQLNRTQVKCSAICKLDLFLLIIFEQVLYEQI